MAEPLDVAYVAQLARLNLTAEETELFQKQLAEILGYAEKLRALDLNDVETTAFPESVSNVLREDEPRDWLTASEALANAPRQANGLFIVPKVME